MKIIEVETKRGDTLLGCLYGEKYKDTCVIITNGTGGNIFENRFLRVLGEKLEKEKISFIYAHNSGAFQMIDLPSKNKNRSGLTFELFDNCVEDLQAYVDFAKQQGYKRIILGGHSYGCNKVIYYLYKTKPEDIENFILVSPVDCKDFSSTERESAKKLIKIAKLYKKENKLDKIMPDLFDGYCFYTARTFLDYIENTHLDNLPVYGDKKHFNQLKSIKMQGLFIMGETDGFAKGNTQEHLDVIYKNSGNKQNITKVISGTGHTFKRKEDEFCREVIEFIK